MWTLILLFIKTNKKLRIKVERLPGVQGQPGLKTKVLSQRVAFPVSFLIALLNTAGLAQCGAS